MKELTTSEIFLTTIMAVFSFGTMIFIIIRMFVFDRKIFQNQIDFAQKLKESDQAEDAYLLEKSIREGAGYLGFYNDLSSYSEVKFIHKRNSRRINK